MFIKNKKFIIFIFLAVGLTAANFALSAVSPYPNLDAVAGGTGLQTATTLPGMVGIVINALLGLLGALFIILIIYAGFLWMTDLGDGKQAQKAKDLIKNSIIGLIIVFASYGLTYFILNNLIKAVK